LKSVATHFAAARPPPLKKGAGHPKLMQYFRVRCYGRVKIKTQWGWQRLHSENNKKTAYREDVCKLFLYLEEKN